MAARVTSKVEHMDMINFGLIPEFIGRLPVIVTLEELTGENLEEILTEPKNALVRQYQKLFGLESSRITKKGLQRNN